MLKIFPIPSAIEIMQAVVTSPLPVPPLMVLNVLLPSKAILVLLSIIGNVFLSFLSSTIPSVAASLDVAAFAARFGLLLNLYFLNVFVRCINSNIRSTFLFKSSSFKVPFLTALIICSYCIFVPGIIRWLPAFICATASSPANQSVITSPL